MKKLIALGSLAAVLAAALVVAQPAGPARDAIAARDSRCFELRTYYATPGKLAALNNRFRDYTNKLFLKHGMTPIGYWIPTDRGQENKIVYILAYPSRPERDKAWAAFGNDPEWKEVVKITEANGRLVARVEAVFMSATDYSPLK